MAKTLNEIASSEVTRLRRRDLLGFAAKGAASVLVSQSVLANCAAAATNMSDTTLSDGATSKGIPVALTFNVSRVANSACTPLTGAYLDVWHCDAAGVYSDVSGSSRKFLRGYQITDANGVAAFTTIYPGWYSGRAVHIHFKLRLYAGSTRSYEFTSQFFFDDSLTDAIYTQVPYSSRGTRDVRNAGDGIYNSLSANDKAGLTLQTTKTSDRYAGVINLGVNVA